MEATEYSMLINGQLVESDSYFEVINPATKSVIAKVPDASEAQLDEAVKAARSAFPSWSALGYPERRKLLLKLADALEAQAPEIIALLSKEQGKPVKGFAGMGAGFEFGGTLAWIRGTCEYELKPELVQENDQVKIETHRKPLGVVGSITPWNYPLMISIWHVIPALLTGNTVVLKPSEMTPLAVLKFAKIAKDILPAGVLNVLTSHGSIGSKMTVHPDIDKIVFTGSTRTGRTIMKSASDSLKRLTLELGGNDAGIVLADADIDTIAPKIFATAFINNGQTCAALKRLYVHESVHDKLCDALVQIAKTVKTGEGLKEDSDFGPLQNANQLKIVTTLAEDAKANGANFLCGGKITDDTGYFYPITLVNNIRDGARLVDEEQFGPILPIIKFSNIEDVLTSANRSEYGLGGSIWTQDLAKGYELANRLESGSVWVNHHGAIQPNAPFGGIKQSGYGSEFGEVGLKEFTSIQTVYVYKA